MEQTMKIEYVFVFTLCELIIYLEMFQRDQSSAIYSSECEKKIENAFHFKCQLLSVASPSLSLPISRWCWSWRFCIRIFAHKFSIFLSLMVEFIVQNRV